MRFSAPGMEIVGGSGSFVGASSGAGGFEFSASGRDWGWVRAGGRVDQARRSELATRTRWKTVVDLFNEVGCGWCSSAQRCWMSLNVEHEKGEDGDDVS